MEGVEDCPEECPSSPRTSSGGELSEQSPPIESRDETAVAVGAVGPMTVVAGIGQQDFWKARKTVLR